MLYLVSFILVRVGGWLDYYDIITISAKSWSFSLDFWLSLAILFSVGSYDFYECLKLLVEYFSEVWFVWWCCLKTEVQCRFLSIHENIKSWFVFLTATHFINFSEIPLVWKIDCQDFHLSYDGRTICQHIKGPLISVEWQRFSLTVILSPDAIQSSVGYTI